MKKAWDFFDILIDIERQTAFFSKAAAPRLGAVNKSDCTCIFPRAICFYTIQFLTLPCKQVGMGRQLISLSLTLASQRSRGYELV
jgi:hypothetical protein